MRRENLGTTCDVLKPQRFPVGSQRFTKHRPAEHVRHNARHDAVVGNVNGKPPADVRVTPEAGLKPRCANTESHLPCAAAAGTQLRRCVFVVRDLLADAG